jgi:hypothetical protein
MDQPLPTRRKVLDLAGEAGVNSDGVNRQIELARCQPGEAVALRLARVGDQVSERMLVRQRHSQLEGWPMRN